MQPRIGAYFWQRRADAGLSDDCRLAIRPLRWSHQPRIARAATLFALHLYPLRLPAGRRHGQLLCFPAHSGLLPGLAPFWLVALLRAARWTCAERPIASTLSGP